MTWSDECSIFIAALAATYQQFTVDEVHEMLDQHGTTTPPEDLKAMGAVLRNMAVREQVIAPLASWFNSTRKTDRPVKVWVGALHPHDGIYPGVTEEHVLWALEAIRTVGQRRSELLVASIRRLNKSSDV